jgi:hypothetical protein
MAARGVGPPDEPPATPAPVPAVAKAPYDSMPPPPPRAPRRPALAPYNAVPHAGPAPDVGDVVDFRPAAAFGKTLAGAWRRGKVARVHAGKTSSRDPTFDVVYDGSTVEPAVRLENIRRVRPFVPATCRRGRPGALERRPEIPAKWAAKLATFVRERQVQTLTERPCAAMPATSPPVTPTQPSPWLRVICDYSGASGPRLAKRVRRLSQSRAAVASPAVGGPLTSPVGVESTGSALLGKRKAEPSPTPAEKKRNYSYHRGGWPGQ